MTVKKIAVFKPINAQVDNVFGTGQYEVFKSINELKEYVEDNFNHDFIVKKWREVFDEK